MVTNFVSILHTRILHVRDEFQGNVAPQEKPVIEVFAWSTVMVFFANIGILIGIYLLGPIISVFVGRFGAALLAFFGVPFYAYYKVKVSKSQLHLKC